MNPIDAYLYYYRLYDPFPAHLYEKYHLFLSN